MTLDACGQFARRQVVGSSQRATLSACVKPERASRLTAPLGRAAADGRRVPALDMAPPYRWYDDFLDAGWPARLSPSALRLVLAIGRRVDVRTLTTRIALKRLRAEAALPHRTFFDAKRELCRHGLVHHAKERGCKTPNLVLTHPVPRVPSGAPGSANPRALRCEPAHSGVQTTAPAEGQKLRLTRKTAVSEQQTKAQLEAQTWGQSQLVTRYLEQQGVPPEFITPFWEAIRSVLAVEEARGQAEAVAGAAFELSRLMQSRGSFWPEVKVADVLERAFAVAHPLAMGALRPFNADTAGMKGVS